MPKSTAKIEAVASMKDNLSSDMRKMGGFVNKTNRAMEGSFIRLSRRSVTSLGSVVGSILAIRKAFSFLGESIKLAGEQEANIASMEQALKNSGQFSVEASKGLQAHASALQKVSTYGDEAIIKAQSYFFQMGLNIEQTKRLTALTLDLSAAKGLNLAKAASLVAKSVGTSTNSLQLHGVVVSGAVGSVERFESTARGLEKVYGGQARAQIDTYSGAVDQMANAWGDLKEKVGEFITKSPTVLKILKSMPEKFEELGKVINEGFAKNAETFLKFVELSASGFLKLGKNIGTAVAKLSLYGKEVQKTRNAALEALREDLKSKRTTKQIAEDENERLKKKLELLKKQRAEAALAAQAAKANLAAQAAKANLEAQAAKNKNTSTNPASNVPSKEKIDAKTKFENLIAAIEQKSYAYKKKLLDADYLAFIKNVKDKVRVQKWYAREIKKLKKDAAFFEDFEEGKNPLEKIFGGFKGGLEEASNGYKTLTESMRDKTGQLVSSMQTQFGSFFNNALRGQLSSARELFANFGDSVLNVLSQIAAEMLALQVLKSLLGGFGSGVAGNYSGSRTLPGGGTEVFAGGQIGGIVTAGGPVVGSHATGSDYIQRGGLARVHKGEAVITAQENRESKRESGEITVVNILDPSMMSNFMSSENGKRIVINHINADILQNGQTRKTIKGI